MSTDHFASSGAAPLDSDEYLAHLAHAVAETFVLNDLVLHGDFMSLADEAGIVLRQEVRRIDAALAPGMDKHEEPSE